MSNIYDHLQILDNRKKKIVPVVSPTVIEEYSLYSNAVDHNEYQYTMIGITGLAMGRIVADGQVYASDAPIQGFAKTMVQVIYEARIRISQQDMFYLVKSGDGAKLDSKVQAQVLSLKNAVVSLKNYIAQTMIANAWSTSVQFTPIGGTDSTTLDTTGNNGVAFFSNSHPREDGGAAQTNIVFSGTTNPSFSLTSLIAARTQHAIKKDGRGLPLLGSDLDTIMFLDKSASYTLAQSIKNTLASGKYPSALPGGSATVTSSTSSPVDASPTGTFDIIGLANYGGTGFTSTMWVAFDSKMKNEFYGLQYVKTMGLETTPFFKDQLGNKDYVSDATEYATFGFASGMYFMGSKGTGLA